MTEKMVENIAKEFKKAVSSKLIDRGMNRRELAKAIDERPDALSLAINSFPVNESAREIRAKIREYLDIEDI
ncbi:hypothetical protein LABALGNA3A7_09420 [Dellaglioa algida]|nr:hypothetical protein LABALGNA3A7_09420 [Dellaglioa algida]